MRRRTFTTGLSICAICAVLGSSTTVAIAEPAEPAEQSTLQCASSATIYRVPTNGDMLLYNHLEPENGTLSWGANPPRIGAAWQQGKPVAAPGGVVYAPWNDGVLRRYRWNGTDWDRFEGGAWHQVIDPTGWDRYTTAEYRNRITVDTEGHIYTVEPDGNLHWRAYDTTNRTWTHHVIDGGWNQFNLIVAAGRGILYARKPNGEMFRYRYHAASQRWLIVGQPVGVGWQTYDRLLSAGGDVLYGIQPGGDMYWYRWDENTQAWISGAGRLVGRAWFDHATTALPDACQRIGTSVPTQPTVPTQPNGPVTLLNTSDNHLHYTYVDAEGRAIHAEATDIASGSPAGLAAVPGFTGVTATSATGEYQDGQVLLVATGTDANQRANTLATNNSWTGTTLRGGFQVTAPSVVRLADNTLVVFALDANNVLWIRRQHGQNGPIGAWRPVASTPLAPARVTVVPTATGARLIGLGRDGLFKTATYDNHILSAWTSLGGPTFTGTASAVVMPDNTVQLFATDTTGTVHTQRQTSTGFPAVWTAIPGVTAAGSPSATMAPDGTLQVATRGTDNFLHYTGQTAPGSGSFTQWSLVTTTEQTSTDPTILGVPNTHTWVIAYLNAERVPKLLRRQTNNPTFTETPLQQER